MPRSLKPFATWVLTILASVLLTVMALETILERPFNGAKAWLRGTNSSQSTFKNIGDCLPGAISELPPRSSAIIGHAYGAPGNSSDFLSRHVESFITNHSEKLDLVVFTGDVIAEPSVAKWQRLSQLSVDTGVLFHVAPGNHDIGSSNDNSRRDIWRETPFAWPGKGLKKIDAAGFTMILEDSVSTGWLISPEVVTQIENLASKNPTLLLRHNIAVSDMQAVANSVEGLSKPLPKLEILSLRLPPRTIVLSGDTGAFPSLPRIACAKENDVTFIASGVGDVPEDIVLIASGGALYTYPLR